MTPPLDLMWLRRWMQPQHLEAAALVACARTCASHPAGLLVLDEFFLEEVAVRLERSLREEIDWRRSYGLYSAAADTNVTEEEWHAAPEGDRLYRFDVPAGVRPSFEWSPNLVTFLKCRQALSDPRFVAFAERLTSHPLAPGAFTAHAMGAGDFLAAHTDAIEDRSVACVVFLARDWTPRCGGSLRISEGGQNWTVDAAFNRLVLFSVRGDGEHAVAPIDTAGATRRLTLGGWFKRRP